MSLLSRSIAGGKRTMKSVQSYIIPSVLFLIPFFLCACGYSREEKQQMKEIAALGEENAIRYIEEKYGFTPKTLGIEVCKDHDDNTSYPPANGYVLANMEYGGRQFQVYINGQTPSQTGIDDYQHDEIVRDAREFFESLLDYEIYDLYLEYKENKIEGDPYADNQQDNLISETYESGSFETFLQRHPSSIRIDDCLNQNLTMLSQINATATAFLDKQAKDHQMKAILISYRSEQDYENGYSHTYGHHRLTDYEIYYDGLYIHSYYTFEEDKSKANRFLLQECEDLIFSYADSENSKDLAITVGANTWMELGETDKTPASSVYSVAAETRGEVTVYLPKTWLARYGRHPAVYIQHYTNDKWRQYDPTRNETKDEQYIFVTYHGVHGCSFDLAVF